MSITQHQTHRDDSAITGLARSRSKLARPHQIDNDLAFAVCRFCRESQGTPGQGLSKQRAREASLWDTMAAQRGFGKTQATGTPQGQGANSGRGSATLATV